MIRSFYPSCSFLRLKRYLFFEVRLDWNPTSKMEKIQHAVCSLRHFGLSWVQQRRSLNSSERSFSSQSLTPTIARSVEKTSVTMKSMLNTRFTGKTWIKVTLADISKDLSKIFKQPNKRAWRELVPVIRKRRILTTLSNKEQRKLLWRNQNSESFQSLKSTLSWRRTPSSEPFLNSLAERFIQGMRKDSSFNFRNY